MQPDRLYIPPRTRLETVWRVGDGSGRWQVWTATADRNAPFAAMLGTMLQLHPNGRAERITLTPDGEMRLIEVMPCVRS